MFDKAMLRLAALSALILAAGAAPAFAATMQCAPNQVVQTTFPSGNTYTGAADGIVLNVANNDIDPLSNAGCVTVGVGGGNGVMLGRLYGANMNVTTDQPFVMFTPAGASFRIAKITCTNASTSLTTAAGGVYTAASKGGTAIVLAAQAYTALTGATLAVDLTLVATPAATFYSSGPILSLTTGQGAAATADCYLFGQVGQ